jgi:ribosomal-protein-serine acetyltransferase
VTISEGLILRVFEEPHALALFKLVDSSRQHLRVWLPFVDAYRTVSAASDFIARFRKKSVEEDGLALGIWFREELAGVITFDRFDWANRATLIGYWLGLPFQGKGLMSRACTSLVDIAFSRLNLNRVEIWCAFENTRCRAVPERLGFKLEGVLRQREWIYDHFVDMAAYSLLASEWKKK